jgi:hypothetical protein
MLPLATQTWYEWFFGSSALVPVPASSRKSSQKPSKKSSKESAIRDRFRFEKYRKTQSQKLQNDPGITSLDILEFIKSLPRHAHLDKEGQEVIYPQFSVVLFLIRSARRYSARFSETFLNALRSTKRNGETEEKFQALAIQTRCGAVKTGTGIHITLNFSPDPRARK